MISIIILNYNTFDLTCQCIESIYKETKKVDFEIIIVDNASTVDDPDKFLELFPKIKLVKNTENRGFAGGCNDGIKVAKGDTILLLNSDTKLLNDAISITYDFLNTHPNVGIVTCRLENEDGSPQNNCYHFPSISKTLIELLRLQKFFPKSNFKKTLYGYFFDYDNIAYPDYIWGAFFMFPKKLLDIFSNQLLPETFWMYFEDMEWCWLARQAGYEVVFVPDGRVLHYGGKNHNPKALKMMNDNFNQFLKLYYNKMNAWIIIRLLKILEWSQWRKWFAKNKE
ncbi:MAG TPA: glycosyltransferase family 2 protein [Bacteroidales bacterium]|nr:glycosyltransferase family 2 protein [Bacteroidales bacterium]